MPPSARSQSRGAGWRTAGPSCWPCRRASRSRSRPSTPSRCWSPRRTCRAGTFLNLDQFVWTPFPSSNLPETYLTRATLGEEGLTGAVIRGAITSGEPLTSGRVIRPGDRGFLAAVLRPGLRAVSVPVDATTGIAGFVFPGDRVDLLLTHEIELSQRVKRLATETVLTDIRVLAVDQRTDDTEGEPTLAKTATLEVDSKSAEVIAVALRMGRLSLALRSLAQYPRRPGDGDPFRSPADLYLGQPGQPSAAPHCRPGTAGARRARQTGTAESHRDGVPARPGGNGGIPGLGIMKPPHSSPGADPGCHRRRGMGICGPIHRNTGTGRNPYGRRARPIRPDRHRSRRGRDAGTGRSGNSGLCRE
ncbi:Flp pilus assembly protein CpaB [Pacificispira sp.]|uniref:Flp pilus assembly protein CpaB n=1 Tax=Pacificispira sp. TaxID=2888761 RepID=UPI003B530591